MKRFSNDLNCPTIMRRALNGADADPLARFRFVARFVDYCCRVSSGEIFWR